MLRWHSILLLLLLLISEGHMSGTVAKLTLDQVARRSDAVLRVEKGDPAVVTRTVKLGKGEGQTFDFTLHRYRVKSVVHSRLEEAQIPKEIEVEDAADADNFAQTRNFIEGKPTKILIYKTYLSANPRIDSLPEFLIFTRFDRQRKRFVFVAKGAEEAVDQEARVLEILAPAPVSHPAPR